MGCCRKAPSVGVSHTRIIVRDEVGDQPGGHEAPGRAPDRIVSSGVGSRAVMRKGHRRRPDGASHQDPARTFAQRPLG